MGWNCTNKEFATAQAIHYLTGYLEATKKGIPDLKIKGTDTVKIDEVLSIINEYIEKETEQLNERFPEKR